MKKEKVFLKHNFQLYTAALETTCNKTWNQLTTVILKMVASSLVPRHKY